MKNKNHDHAKKPRAFSKGQSELTITLIGWTLTKSGNELVFGHSPQTLTTEVVKMLYPRDRKHIGYQLQCDNNARTSNASIKERY